MPDSPPALTLHALPPGFGAALAQALCAGLSPEEKGRMFRELLDGGERIEVGAMLAREGTFYSAEEAGALIGWKARGFQARATAENCPHLPGGPNKPWLYAHRDVMALFERLKLWPKGRSHDFAGRHERAA